MTNTPCLNLPYILPSQAQKHVTHNEALRILDGLVQTKLIDRDLNISPQLPLAGDCYLVGAAPQGEWAGQAGNLAIYQDGSWHFQTPNEGWTAWLSSEARLIVFNGTQWGYVASADQDAGANQLLQLGINTAADEYNRLAIKSEAVLLSHDDNGSGNHYLTLNKSQDSSVNSVLFQSNFSGRAEIGLVGDNNLRIKVTDDGSLWRDAIVVNAQTGDVQFPSSPNLYAGSSAEPITINMSIENRLAPALLMQGTARNSSADEDDGVGLFLTNNTPSNRQFALLSTDSLIGIRVIAAASPVLDGFANGNRADLQIGTNTNGAHVGFSVSNTQFSVSNWAGSPAKTIMEIVGGSNQSGDLLSIGSSLTNRGDSLRVSADQSSHFGGPVTLKSYIVTELPQTASDGAMVFVTNESGGAVPAFHDGTDWRRCTDRAVVS